jgi:hypothetical protein
MVSLSLLILLLGAARDRHQWDFRSEPCHLEAPLCRLYVGHDRIRPPGRHARGDRLGDEVITRTGVNGAIALQRRHSRGLRRCCFAPSHKPRAAKGRRLAARWTASQMPIDQRTSGAPIAGVPR